MNAFVKAVIVSGIVVQLAACDRIVCDDDLQAQVRSPGGVLVATSYFRNCGATTDYSTIINLHRTDHGFRDNGGDLFVAKGRHALRMEWKSGNRLYVECQSCERKLISKMVTVLGSTNVSFGVPLERADLHTPLDELLPP